MNTYTVPKYDESAYNCPHCHVYAVQYWTKSIRRDTHGYQISSNVSIATCSKCNSCTVWYKEDMIYPDESIIAQPLASMPEDVKKNYLEARSIFNKSPRGACALLRLAIQKFSIELGCQGKNLNNDIGELVKKGLPSKVQEALDIVRVVGNNAVHPGQLDIDDNKEIAESLFKLLNFIVEKMIVEPNKIDSLFDSLPDGAKKGIKLRDIN